MFTVRLLYQFTRTKDIWRSVIYCRAAFSDYKQMCADATGRSYVAWPDKRATQAVVICLTIDKMTLPETLKNF